MTTIAWDGKTLAADKQATCAGLRGTTTKIRRTPTGHLMAWTGDEDSGRAVAGWYEEGADPAKWPKCQEDKELWSRLIVVNCVGEAFTFERQPIAMRVEDAFMAWGSGRDFAMAAMHCGKTAREAVTVASHYDVSTGMGVDAFDL